MMKLNLLFILMDLLTLMVYPILFVYGKLRRSVKTRENTLLANLLVAILVTPDK